MVFYCRIIFRVQGWQVREKSAEMIMNITKIFHELYADENELAASAETLDHEFSVPPDETMLSALRTISDWTGSHGHQPIAFATFRQIVNCWLAVHVLTHQHIIVAHQGPVGATSKIGSLNACISLRCPTFRAMPRRERTGLVLRKNGIMT